MMKYICWAWYALRPPYGSEVRRLIALLALAVGLTRTLPFLTALPERWMPTQAYGLMLLIVGGALLVTARKRLGRRGRGVAALGAGVWAMLEADLVISNMAATWIYGLLAFALIGEAGSRDG